MEEVFGKNHPFTHLVPDLKGVDPDDAFSSVPYEKGSNLLMYLEQKLGGPGMFSINENINITCLWNKKCEIEKNSPHKILCYFCRSI